jgi:hypothetical protein
VRVGKRCRLVEAVIVRLMLLELSVELNGKDPGPHRPGRQADIDTQVPLCWERGRPVRNAPARSQAEF